MPWYSAANRQITIGRVARRVACNAWVDLFANREWRFFCKKLTRFLRSRVLIAELMRVLWEPLRLETSELSLDDCNP